MIRVYIAGPLNGDAMEYLANVNRFLEAERLLRRNGFAPYNPAADLLAGVYAGTLEYDDLADANLAWLEVADAIYVIARSPGADREVMRAYERNIPVCWSLNDLRRQTMEVFL